MSTMAKIEEHHHSPTLSPWLRCSMASYEEG